MAPIHNDARKTATTVTAQTTRDAESMLRDLAFVLKMTRQVKDEIVGVGGPVNRIAAIDMTAVPVGV